MRVLEHWEAWELCFDDWGMFRYDFGGFGVLETRLGMAQGGAPRPFFEEAGGAFTLAGLRGP